MFFSESRYLKVKEYTVTDAQGRSVKVKRTRATLDLTGSFQYTVKAGDRLVVADLRRESGPDVSGRSAEAGTGFDYSAEPGLSGIGTAEKRDRH